MLEYISIRTEGCWGRQILTDIYCFWLCQIGCQGFTDAGLAYLENLREITLRGCDQITDEGLRHLGNLQTLNLSHCRGDAGLAFLVILNKIDLTL
jgi:hypothetical protein